MIDPLGQIAHFRDPIRDFLTQQHAAAARLGALADHNFDGIRFSQVVRIHTVTRRQILIDQGFRLAAFFRRHAAIACRGRGAGDRCTTPKRLFRLRRQRTETHAGNGDRNVQFDRLLGKLGAEHHLGAACLAIPFEGIARHGGAEEQQIVKMRHHPLGATAADIINARRRRPADFGQGIIVEGRRLARQGTWDLCSHCFSLNMHPRCRCRNCTMPAPSHSA